MNIVDLLITIIVVTILVTIAFGLVTYLTYRLRRARRPLPKASDGDGSRYFVRYAPDHEAERKD